MFPKPAFGGTTSGFGSFNSGTTAASPFGGFKSTTGTSAFGAPPAFGANATAAQPTTGGGLFGASNTSTGLFGASTSTAAPAFGTGTGFGGFGTTTSTAGGGLFGASATTGGGLFGGQNNSFGAKPAGFGFGNTTAASPASGSLFGSAAPSTSLFGQQQTTTLGGGGLFANNTGAFGQQPTAAGTAHVKYNPVVGTDVVVKSGTSQNINIKHHCITCMKEYEGKSLEELRLEDYVAGRKGSANAGVFGGFGAQTENKPLFGGNTSFGQPAATTASSVFGGGGLSTAGGFGQTANTFSFGNSGQTAANTSGGLFGAAKPAFGAPTTGTGLFGAATTQAQTFGTATPSFGFGSNTQPQQQTGGLFGAKPATSGFGGFGATPIGGFGASGGLFNKPAQSAAAAFGTTTPAFGGISGGFGTATSSAGGLFNNTFGKPAAAPAFGFNNPTPGLGTGLGTGLANSFQAKPATGFGQLGGGNMFGQAQAQPNFSSGLDSSLGGGMFGNQSALGGSALGLGALGGNANFANNNLLGSSASGNVHEQILTLVARPYGDTALFKDLVPDAKTSTADDIMKPTNPAAVNAVLSSNSYRVTSPGSRLKVTPQRMSQGPTDKKSLFDGLEESDASLEDKLSLKPSRKRLVLRPKEHDGDKAEQPIQNRPLEEPHRDMNGTKDAEQNTSEDKHGRDASSFTENNNLENSSDRHGSWLNASKHQWSAEKEKPIDEPTPRLYPSLDKDLQVHISERRASWLTTKPLRKPLASNPELAENSVRELGLRPDRVDRSSDRIEISSEHIEQSSIRVDRSTDSIERTSRDKENLESFASDENVAARELPPHPTGVKLTRPGYYTIPSLDDCIKYMRPDGSCVVPHFTIGRKNYGNVFYDCEIDIGGLDLDSLVHFMNKEVTIYPDDSNKPPVGSSLNRRAIVTLDRAWPRDKTERRPITEPDRLLAMDYEGKLRRVCDKHDTKFIEYRPHTGSWVFRVEHFSKYSLTDSDEEDDITPEVIKRQVINQQLQKSAPLAPTKPVTIPSPGLGGLGGGGLVSGGLSGAGLVSGGLGNSVLSQDTTGLGLSAVSGLGAYSSLSGLSGLSQVALGRDSFRKLGSITFEMDTTEDNTESQSLYQDSHRAFGVKSPTSELARLENRQSHNVQLMKASLYADTEMDDDMSVSLSTGDQLVPRALIAAPSPPPVEVTQETIAGDVITVTTDEITMKPLLVQPQTIVLKYHRKVPPFKETIAGRLDAACIADMSVCRARHSRAGFGPSGAIVFATTYDAIDHLPTSTDLSELHRYVGGRASNDWSGPSVVRMALGQRDKDSHILDTLTRHLDTLLAHSVTLEMDEVNVPRLIMRSEPKDRRSALTQLIKDFTNTSDKGQFGVSSAYCLQVFKLCEALWGADLENDGVPGVDEQSIVNRHRKLLEWLTNAASLTVDRQFGEPADSDDSDAHSGKVFALMVAGRILEACKVAKQHGDLNMAMLIAQAAGDSTFRSLISRQLSTWRQSGADTLVCAPRLASLSLAAGVPPHAELTEMDWLSAFHVTARYLCPQVPSLEHIIRTYEALFTAQPDGDLTAVTDDVTEMTMQYPITEHDATLNNSGCKRRVLDLRYELLRARAMNARPKLQPAAYSPDPMDYGLSFVLGVWFGNPTASTVSGLSAQLESCGEWHRAVHALAYHPDDYARAHLIKAVLSRHAPAKADTPELKDRLELMERLQVPQEWVLLARAHRAKYEHLPLLEAEFLAGARQWNAAHQVLLSHLLCDVVLADNLQSISGLLSVLNEAAGRHEVSGWESGGQALHLYMHVCDEIRGLVSSASCDRREVSTRLEALRPLVATACRAIGALPTHTPRQAAARTEMGARLLQLALAGGESPQQLVGLLKALSLPPDTTGHVRHKITTELADLASERCIESATGSPMSGHHRATGAAHS